MDMTGFRWSSTISCDRRRRASPAGRARAGGARAERWAGRSRAMRSVKRPQAGCTLSPARDAREQRGQREVDQQRDARDVADQDDGAAQAVVEVVEAALERAVEGPDERRAAATRCRARGLAATRTPGPAQAGRGAADRRLIASPPWRRRRARLGDGRAARRAGIVDRAGRAADDLHRDLGGRVRPVVAGAVDAGRSRAASCARPARRSPWSTARPWRGRRARRRRTTCTDAASCTRRAWLRGDCGARRRAKAHQLVEREAVAREARRSGLAGEPVDVAAALARRRPARTRCARCRRGGCTTGRSG